MSKGNIIMFAGIVAFLFLKEVNAQTNLLSKRISISVESIPMEQALMKLSEVGGFNFSYNSDIFRSDSLVTLKVRNKPVENALKLLFADKMRYKVVGNHIIILPNSEKKNTERTANKEYGMGAYTITGYVFDASTGLALPNATIYEVDGKIVAYSNSIGFYKIVLPSDLNLKGLTYCRYGYLDSILLIRPSKSVQIDVSLQPKQKELIKIQTRTTVLQSDLHGSSIVNWLVPNETMLNAENLKVYEKKTFQVSLLPFVGSNYTLSGTATNNLSLNILAGYSGSVDGIELGGLFNIVKNDVKGLQMAGWGNIVGNNTEGIQMAGYFNLNMGSVTGAQLAGFQNTLRGEMHGIQVSGFNNVTTQHVDGAQITGFVNVALKDVRLAQVAGFVNYGGNIGGIQASGFVNVAMGDVEMAQLTGFVNYGKNIGGLQAAGFVNYADGDVDAAQLAGFVNVCNSVTGTQLAGFVNVAYDTVEAFQGAGFVNYGGSVTGTQLAGFVNVATVENTGFQGAAFVNITQILNGVQLATVNVCDTVESGVPIGFFSFVRKGYHVVELSSDETFFANVAFKTGTARFYNIFKFGKSTANLYSYSYGLGFKRPLKGKHSLDFDFTFSTLQDNGNQTVSVGKLFKFQPWYSYRVAKYFTLAVGPSVSVYNAKIQDSESLFNNIAFHPFYTKDYSGNRLQMWAGIALGM